MMPLAERLDQIKRMIEIENKSPAEIAALTGLTKRTVAVYASRAKARGKHHRPRYGVRKVLYVDPRIKRTLEYEAARRSYLDAAELIEALLTNVADDNLFGAILDA